jgi:hypothetical protein
MEKIIINIKDRDKLKFLSELLTQFDWLDFKIKEAEDVKEEKEYDFFASAGMLKGRDIDADKLRQQAWKIEK